MPIQTEVGLSLEFKMGLIPIDDTGCFVKYTFPNDIQLPTTTLTYQGYDMMQNDRGSSNLNVKNEVFITNQVFARGNYIVVKGCQGLVGPGRLPKFKVTGIFTPSAQKQTNLFTVEMYKSFDEGTYTLSNHILSGQGKITKDKFTSGAITNGVFDGQFKFI